MALRQAVQFSQFLLHEILNKHFVFFVYIQWATKAKHLPELYMKAIDKYTELSCINSEYTYEGEKKPQREYIRWEEKYKQSAKKNQYY